MANIAIFRINYKSDFILTLNSDAGWMTPFCIKFWTGAPSHAYFAGYDGETYTHCAPVAGDPTKLEVQFDDHHLPIGDLKFQIGYHFTVADFPTTVEDEVINQSAVIIDQDGTPMQVMLDLNGETAPEIQFSLPAYANEAQRIANEQQRIANETQRIANEETRIQHEESRIAAEQTRQQNEQQRINQEQARIEEYAGLKADAVAATGAANDAAALANQKAQLAADKAALAQDASDLANAKAQLAADKAALAESAATLANQKAALAQQKAEYAQEQGTYSKNQGDYAKEQGDYSKAQGDYAKDQGDYSKSKGDYAKNQGDYSKQQGDYAKEQGEICAADHLVAVEDHQTAAADHQTATTDHSTALSDHTQAVNDHTRAESDHTRAESDHDAVELYVDSLGVFDLSKHNAVGGVLATYADLDAALNALNALESKYKYGGMSVKFVHSVDNKYVQCRLMADEFTTDISEWQGVDDEPTTGSKNLVTSGGVADTIGRKVDIKCGANLVNPDTLLLNKAISLSSRSIQTLENYSLSDYIPVNGSDIVSNAINNNTYWGHAVYASDKQTILRVFNSSVYTYQEGDAYVRFTFVSSTLPKIANYGSTITDKEYNPIEGYMTGIEEQINENIVSVSHEPNGGYTVSKAGTPQATLVSQNPQEDRIDISIFGTALNYSLVGDGRAKTENGFELRKYAVTAGDTLYLKLSKDTGVDCVCQWQNTESITTATWINCIATPILEAVDGCVIVPNGATHLIVCCATGNSTNKVQRCNNVADTEKATAVRTSIGLDTNDLILKQGVSAIPVKRVYETGTISKCEIEGGSASAATDIKETVLSSTFTQSQISFEQGERYLWNWGALLDNAAYYVQKIVVEHDKYYHIKAFMFSLNLGTLALYDVDNNVIEIINATFDKFYKFPENVHHIAVSALFGDWEYVVIEKVNIADYVFPVEKIDGLGATLNDLQENKVDSKSINLVNPDKIEDDKAIYIYNSSYEIRTMSGYSLSGYIPVKGHNIASNAVNNNSFWGHAVYNVDKVKIRTFNTSNYTYQEGDVYVRFSFASDITTAGEQMANYGNSVLPYEAFNPIAAYIPETDNSSLSGKLEVAIGKTFSSGSYESEIEAQPIVNNQGNYYVGYKEVTKPRNDKRYRRIVAVNHDDLPQADYIATRKIYNKYGFNASFCFILQPFFDASHKSSMVDAVRRLLHEGHEMGLHAIMNSSYWRANKMVDVRPDGGSNFAPQYSELIGHNSDKTGVNDYEQSITATTKLSALGYANPVNSQNAASDLVVVSMTEAELNDVNASYNFYSSKRTLSGLDEEDTAQTKTHLAWLEYWYNLWIDNTLGTSSAAASLADRFAEDYSVPEGATVGDYYPDAEHMWNGKMVYWNDITNAHYADAKVKTTAGFSTDDYQLVGKFTKGLYKDCFSTANYEVMDRVINIAQEFARRYFGLDHFTDTHIHGVNYINIQTSIFLKNKGFIVGGHGKFYRSRLGCFSEEIDLLNEFGINLIDYDTNQVSYEGQVGLYQGMDGRMDTRVSSGRSNSLVFVSYLNFFGNNVSENMSYSAFVGFTNKLDNWLKFAYENAGQQVTRGGYTYTVFDALKNSIDIIRATFDTGKIPVLSLDTLGANPSTVAAIGIVCDYCKKNNVDIVSLSEARRLAMDSVIKANYFPNPAFIQSLLLEFGGSSTDMDVYIPDGWRKESLASGSAVAVSDTTISDKTYKALTLTGEGVLETRIYGIPSGNYKLSFYASGSSSEIKCWIKKNKDLRSVTGVTPSYTPTLDGTMTLCEFTFTVDNDTKGAVSDTAASKFSGGYENNFSNLQIRIEGVAGGYVSIASPSVKLI